MYISEYDALGNIYNCDKGGGIKKTVYKYNLDGSLSKSFENLTLALETICVRKQDICRACWNINHILGGYLWNNENTESFLPEIDNRKKEVIQFF